jgi:hypothetical protein
VLRLLVNECQQDQYSTALCISHHGQNRSAEDPIADPDILRCVRFKIHILVPLRAKVLRILNGSHSTVCTYLLYVSTSSPPTTRKCQCQNMSEYSNCRPMSDVSPKCQNIYVRLPAQRYQSSCLQNVRMSDCCLASDRTSRDAGTDRPSNSNFEISVAPSNVTRNGLLPDLLQLKTWF